MYRHRFEGLRPSAGLSADMELVVGKAPFALRSWDGCGTPVVEPGRIEFNGDAGAGLEYESFSLVSGEGRSFRERAGICTTNRMPYDDAVVACLAGAVDLELDGADGISSDGNVLDWYRGICLLEEATGRRLSDDAARWLAGALGMPDGWSAFEVSSRRLLDMAWWKRRVDGVRRSLCEGALSRAGLDPEPTMADGEFVTCISGNVLETGDRPFEDMSLSEMVSLHRRMSACHAVWRAYAPGGRGGDGPIPISGGHASADDIARAAVGLGVDAAVRAWADGVPLGDVVA